MELRASTMATSASHTHTHTDERTSFLPSGQQRGEPTWNSVSLLTLTSLTLSQLEACPRNSHRPNLPQSIEIGLLGFKSFWNRAFPPDSDALLSLHTASRVAANNTQPKMLGSQPHFGPCASSCMQPSSCRAFAERWVKSNTLCLLTSHFHSAFRTTPRLASTVSSSMGVTVQLDAVLLRRRTDEQLVPTSSGSP